MSFSWESSYSKSFYDTSITFTSSNTNYVTHFIFRENLVNSNFFFKKIMNEINFIFSSSSINLNFHKMSFFIFKLNFFWLSMDKSSNDTTVLVDSFKLDTDLISIITFIFFGIFGKTFFLRFIPVFIESSFDTFVKLLSPNSGKCSESSWSFSITDKTYNFHRWGFNDSNSFITFFFINLRSTSFYKSDNMGHTSFPTHEGSKVTWFS